MRSRRASHGSARPLNCDVRRTPEGIVLVADQEFALYPEWSRAIESDSTRAAFHYLVGIAASSRRFHCHAQWKGEVRDFRFIDPTSREQPYSFITNQQWLLFYFRSPAIRSNQYSRDSISKAFDTFHENPAGEWTLKLAAVPDVQRLCNVVDFQ
jgi:hypothetical protein